MQTHQKLSPGMISEGQLEIRGVNFLPDFYTFSTTARRGFTGDGPTQATSHLLCKFSEHTPWTYLCNPCLLEWPAWLGALQCSREEGMECNCAVWAPKLPAVTEAPWAISSVMSQRCGSHANTSPCTLCPTQRFAAPWASSTALALQTNSSLEW